MAGVSTMIAKVKEIERKRVRTVWVAGLRKAWVSRVHCRGVENSVGEQSSL